MSNMTEKCMHVNDNDRYPKDGSVMDSDQM